MHVGPVWVGVGVGSDKGKCNCNKIVFVLYIDKQRCQVIKLFLHVHFIPTLITDPSGKV